MIASVIASVIASPCTTVCKTQDGVCAGCLRTLAEIARWSNAGDDEKLRILAAVAQRRTAPGAD